MEEHKELVNSFESNPHLSLFGLENPQKSVRWVFLFDNKSVSIKCGHLISYSVPLENVYNSGTCSLCIGKKYIEAGKEDNQPGDTSESGTSTNKRRRKTPTTPKIVLPANFSKSEIYKQIIKNLDNMDVTFEVFNESIKTYDAMLFKAFPGKASQWRTYVFGRSRCQESYLTTLGLGELNSPQKWMAIYFTPANPNPGVFINYPVGSGKTIVAWACLGNFRIMENAKLYYVTKSALQEDIKKGQWAFLATPVKDLKKYHDNSELPYVMEKDSTGTTNRIKELRPEDVITSLGHTKFINYISGRNEEGRTKVYNFAPPKKVKDILKLFLQKCEQAFVIDEITGKCTQKVPFDPLKNAVVFIDEIHRFPEKFLKLLYAIVKNSYKMSGINHVRLMLATATPIIENPMYALKYLNLLIRNPERRFSKKKQWKNEYEEAVKNNLSPGAINAKYLEFLLSEQTSLNKESVLSKSMTGLVSYIDISKDYDHFSIIKKINVEVISKGSSNTKDIPNHFYSVCSKEYEANIDKYMSGNEEGGFSDEEEEEEEEGSDEEEYKIKKKKRKNMNVKNTREMKSGTNTVKENLNKKLIDTNINIIRKKESLCLYLDGQMVDKRELALGHNKRNTNKILRIIDSGNSPKVIALIEEIFIQDDSDRGKLKQMIFSDTSGFEGSPWIASALFAMGFGWKLLSRVPPSVTPKGNRKVRISKKREPTMKLDQVIYENYEKINLDKYPNIKGYIEKIRSNKELFVFIFLSKNTLLQSNSEVVHAGQVNGYNKTYHSFRSKSDLKMRLLSNPKTLKPGKEEEGEDSESESSEISSDTEEEEEEEKVETFISDTIRGELTENKMDAQTLADSKIYCLLLLDSTDKKVSPGIYIHKNFEYGLSFQLVDISVFNLNSNFIEEYKLYTSNDIIPSRYYRGQEPKLEGKIGRSTGRLSRKALDPLDIMIIMEAEKAFLTDIISHMEEKGLLNWDPELSVNEKIDATMESLTYFNDRSTNRVGENARFIILQKELKEGIDLFDVGGEHIWEIPLTPGDQTQIIGRGNRRCGNVGIAKSIGKWFLHVCIYTCGVKFGIEKISETLKLTRDKTTLCRPNDIIVDLVNSDLSSKLREELGGKFKQYAFDKNINEVQEKNQKQKTGYVYMQAVERLNKEGLYKKRNEEGYDGNEKHYVYIDIERGKLKEELELVLNEKSLTSAINEIMNKETIEKQILKVPVSVNHEFYKKLIKEEYSTKVTAIIQTKGKKTWLGALFNSYKKRRTSNQRCISRKFIMRKKEKKNEEYNLTASGNLVVEKKDGLPLIKMNNKEPFDIMIQDFEQMDIETYISNEVVGIAKRGYQMKDIRVIRNLPIGMSYKEKLDILTTYQDESDMIVELEHEQLIAYIVALRSCNILDSMNALKLLYQLNFQVEVIKPLCMIVNSGAVIKRIEDNSHWMTEENNKNSSAIFLLQYMTEMDLDELIWSLIRVGCVVDDQLFNVILNAMETNKNNLFEVPKVNMLNRILGDDSFLKIVFTEAITMKSKPVDKLLVYIKEKTGNSKKGASNNRITALKTLLKIAMMTYEDITGITGQWEDKRRASRVPFYIDKEAEFINSMNLMYGKCLETLLVKRNAIVNRDVVSDAQKVVVTLSKMGFEDEQYMEGALSIFYSKDFDLANTLLHIKDYFPKFPFQFKDIWTQYAEHLGNLKDQDQEIADAIASSNADLDQYKLKKKGKVKPLYAIYTGFAFTSNFTGTLTNNPNGMLSMKSLRLCSNLSKGTTYVCTFMGNNEDTIELNQENISGYDKADFKIKTLWENGYILIADPREIIKYNKLVKIIVESWQIKKGDKEMFKTVVMENIELLKDMSLAIINNKISGFSGDLKLTFPLALTLMLQYEFNEDLMKSMRTQIPAFRMKIGEGNSVLYNDFINFLSDPARQEKWIQTKSAITGLMSSAVEMIKKITNEFVAELISDFLTNMVDIMDSDIFRSSELGMSITHTKKMLNEDISKAIKYLSLNEYDFIKTMTFVCKEEVVKTKEYTQNLFTMTNSKKRFNESSSFFSGVNIDHLFSPKIRPK